MTNSRATGDADGTGVHSRNSVADGSFRSDSVRRADNDAVCTLHTLCTLQCRMSHGVSRCNVTSMEPEESHCCPCTKVDEHDCKLLAEILAYMHAQKQISVVSSNKSRFIRMPLLTEPQGHHLRQVLAKNSGAAPAGNQILVNIILHTASH